MPLGVEFSGGTIVIVSSSSARHRAGARRARQGCRAAARTRSSSATAIRRTNQVMIRVPTVGAESGRRAEPDGRRRRRRAEEGRASAESAGRRHRRCVGPSRRPTRADCGRGILATVFALAGILVYIAFRFQFSFAVGAVVATIHDLLITLAFLAFFRYDLSLNVIAALLTITGYSMNDTIVIFDRVRENMRVDAARQPRAASSTPRSTRCWTGR